MLYFITGNKNKIAVAKSFLTPVGITFEPKSLELTEIQSHSIEEVAKDKAVQAYKILQEPLFVSDHGWSIPALNGFPGAYMRYVNEWLTVKDFLSLMQGKTNRDIYLIEVLCFIDKNRTQTFSAKHKGTILHEPQGDGKPGITCVSLTEDGISIAKKIETQPSALEVDTVWRELAEWLKDNAKV